MKDYEPQPILDGIKIEYVSNFYIRTKRIFDRSESFIILPGGSGTLAELSMLVALKGANLLNKPINLINTNDWFNPILEYYKEALKNNVVHFNVFDVVKVIDSFEDAVLCFDR